MPRLPDRVHDYLRDHHVMTLATQGADGPWAAAVFYVHDGFRLLFLSSPTSRHSLNLERDPRVAATIQRDHSQWHDIRGVQLEGHVRELAGSEAARARTLYGAKYPLIAELARAPVAIIRAMSKVRWYELAAERLYFIDNAIAFGHRDEIVPGEPAASGEAG